MSKTHRYFLDISYNGANYHGWQIQPNAISVQEVMDKTLSTFLKEEIITVGAGRTDTGVHAEFFILHFDSKNHRLHEVKDLIFDTRTGELIQLMLKSPTDFATNIELEQDKNNNLLIPFSAVMAVGDFVVVSEEEQLNQLVSGDLSKAVYVSSYLNLKNKELILEDYRDRFNILQKENFIKRIDFDNPNKIDIAIEVKIPAMLVLSEVWYPGWEVIVDGEPKPVHRVNYCQRGVWLEKGTHYVKFRFKPQKWQWGLMVSLGTMALLLMVTVVRVLLMLKRRSS